MVFVIALFIINVAVWHNSSRAIDGLVNQKTKNINVRNILGNVPDYIQKHVPTNSYNKKLSFILPPYYNVAFNIWSVIYVLGQMSTHFSTADVIKTIVHFRKH